MGLFKKRKKVEEVIDDRSDLEKKCEETGQNIGKKTGQLVQKGVDKINGVKQNLEDNGTMDKVRNVQTKVDQTLDQVVDQVTKQTKKVVEKVQKKEKKEFYE